METIFLMNYSILNFFKGKNLSCPILFYRKDNFLLNYYSWIIKVPIKLFFPEKIFLLNFLTFLSAFCDDFLVQPQTSHEKMPFFLSEWSFPIVNQHGIMFLNDPSEYLNSERRKLKKRTEEGQKVCQQKLIMVLEKYIK